MNGLTHTFREFVDVSSVSKSSIFDGKVVVEQHTSEGTHMFNVLRFCFKISNCTRVISLSQW